jgi:hypothetical protein
MHLQLSNAGVPVVPLLSPGPSRWWWIGRLPGHWQDREEAGTMVASSEICQMEATTLSRRITAKDLSPVEAVDAVLDRLDRLDPTLHMFTTVVPDQAREAAKQIEAEIAAGGEARPLARGADRGEGPDLHQGDPHGLGVARLRRLRT